MPDDVVATTMSRMGCVPTVTGVVFRWFALALLNPKLDHIGHLTGTVYAAQKATQMPGQRDDTDTQNFKH